MSLLLGLFVGLVIGVVVGVVWTRGTLGARAKAAEDKLAYVEGGLSERFQALSAQVLDASNQRFLDLAGARLATVGAETAGELDKRMAPIKDTLGKVEEQLRAVETGRRESHAMLAKEVEFVRHSSDQLRQETRTLVRALQRPEARGRWGELQLRRVVELAGMARHCDFDEQVTAADGARPDMVVRLAGGKTIVVDSKVSLAAYLEAAGADEPAISRARLDAHARHLREHVDRLAAKAYWSSFRPAPEFVVLFVPGEAFLAPALERDPGLLEHAMRRRVHIATPTTLITMLRTANYAWQQEALSANARAVFDLGRELYERLSTLGRHLDRLGKSLTNSVVAYNRTIGSLESRVLVTARRLNELGLTEEGLEAPPQVDEPARPLSAAELADDAETDRQIRLLP